MSTPLPDHDQARRLLWQMVRIRRFEEKCVEMYSAQKIRGFMHLYIGEEAVATGVIDQLLPEDAIVATYREHGQALVRGVSANSIMAEMYGKVEGCARGRGGSMHLFDAKTRFCGGNAIVGGGLPLAIGLALADKMQNRKAVTVCFFGEGAVAEGEFHETLNLAGLWQLPVLFVCENNLYAMGTALRYTESKMEIASKGDGYGVANAVVDGMDVLAVNEAARKAIATTREGKPFLLECRTYRFRAHSMFDAEIYRSRDEVAEWKKRDPITMFFDAMKAAKVLSDSDLEAIETEVAKEVDESVAFAEAGTWEPVSDLTRFVYSEVTAS
ncbi:MAG: pyruvate dehydrogenase (acetyl-transferring) E1 component subunit alpha [Prosthecobacter sp.]|uniref:pyruvate dehydrogenase (acetyl-transferring) E1 component subunit alpha n=1 Tax=Prosthecobacter sp. TaxID=1965333 RepID=UPI0025D9FFD7|nr:pyruvate dehydrogenase (acetyl-transferring) E1 component subunit alpha [Prosthecobacter sp.]MCF7787165.1 pyruvate dehydrogenase (acetyl-transferring) E1 component subunit alpha [Prosthecobacter sp.]